MPRVLLGMTAPQRKKGFHSHNANSTRSKKLSSIPALGKQWQDQMVDLNLNMSAITLGKRKSSQHPKSRPRVLDDKSVGDKNKTNGVLST